MLQYKVKLVAFWDTGLFVRGTVRPPIFVSSHLDDETNPPIQVVVGRMREERDG